MDLSLVKEILNESRLIKDTGHLKNYTYRDILDFLFLYFLTLQILRKEPEHSDEVKAYVGRTMTWNGRFDYFKLAGNDLYQFLHFVVGKERKLELLKDANDRLVKYAKIDWGNLRTYLNDLRFGRDNEAFENRFMLKLESDLLVTESNYRSLRRLIRDWKDKDYSQRSLIITRLLQAYRIRMFRAELRKPLEDLAKKFRFEIQGAQNPELKEAKMYKLTPFVPYPSKDKHFQKEIKVWRNPSSRDILNLFKNISSELRGSVNKKGDVFVWDAFKANHNAFNWKDVYGDEDSDDEIYFYLSDSAKISASEWNVVEIFPGFYADFFSTDDYVSLGSEQAKNLILRNSNITRMLKPIKQIKESSGKIGPHAGKEFHLMFTGQKPAALVGNDEDPEKIRKFKELKRTGRVKEFPMKFALKKDSDNWVYTLPGEEWRADEIRDIYDEVRRTGKMTNKHHRRMGQLLGYSEDDIKAFLDQSLQRQNIEEKIQEPFGLPPDVVDAFVKLGSAQRDKPESAMLRVQHAIGGGVLSFAVEHIGDLTHRMTHMVPYENLGTEMVADKVTKILRALRNPYGFEREHLENVKNNAAYRKISYEEAKKKVDDALKAYAQEHNKLPVYNKAQWMARESAIALGEQDFYRAETFLGALERMLEKGKFKDEAIKYYKDEYGRLRNWSHGLEEGEKLEESHKARIDFNNAWKLVEENCSQILEIYKRNKAVFLRGAGGGLSIFVSSPREDRSPRDLDPKLHDIAVEYFQKKGFKANRDNSIFVSGQKLDSLRKITTYGYYGRTYIIFPYDNFDYTWSPKITDLYNRFGKIITKEKPKRKEGEEYYDYHERIFRDLLKNSGYTNKNLEKVFDIDASGDIAVGHTPEVMMKPKKYIAFKADTFLSIIKDKILGKKSIKEAKLETELLGNKIFKNPSYNDFKNIIYNSKFETVRTLMDLEGKNIWVWDARTVAHDTAYKYLSEAYPDNFKGRIWYSIPARFLIAGNKEVPDQFNFGGDSYTDAEGMKDYEWAKKKPIFQRMMKGAEHFEWDKESADDLHWSKFQHALRMGESAGVGKVVKGVNTTADVGPGETKKQAKKFGFKLDKKNEPPKLAETKLIKDFRFPIWKNPTKQSLKQLIDRFKELRGNVDKDGNVYVWKAYDGSHTEGIDIIYDLTNQGRIADLYFSNTGKPEAMEWGHYMKMSPFGFYYGVSKLHGFELVKNKVFDKLVMKYPELGESNISEARVFAKIEGYTATYPIIQNPTNDWFEKVKTARFLLDKKGNIYAWDATKSLHPSVVSALGDNFRDNLHPLQRFGKSYEPSNPEISHMAFSISTESSPRFYFLYADASDWSLTSDLKKLWDIVKSNKNFQRMTSGKKVMHYKTFGYDGNGLEERKSIPKLRNGKNLNEWKVGYTVKDEPILIDPSNNDLETLLRKSKYKAVRFGFDDEDNLWAWNADDLTHEDVRRGGLNIEDEGFSLMKDNKGNYGVWADAEGLELDYGKIEDDSKFVRMTKGKAYFDLEAGRNFWDFVYGQSNEEELDEIKIFKPSSEDDRVDIDQKELLDIRFHNFKSEITPKEFMTIGKYKVLVNQLTKSRNKRIRMFMIDENKNPIGQITFEPDNKPFHPDVFTIIWSFILPEHRGQKIIEQIYEKMLNIGYVLISDIEQSKASAKIWQNLFDKYPMYSYEATDLSLHNPRKEKFERIRVKSDLGNAYKDVDTRLIVSKNKLGLNESTSRKEIKYKDTDDAKKGRRIAKLIQKNCKPWFDSAGLGLVFRGIEDSRPILKGKIRSNRKPLETPSDFQEMADEIFSKLGFKALRKNSLFVSGDEIEAGAYGTNTYVVFPIGEFSFSWSKGIHDFYRHFIADEIIRNFEKSNGEISKPKLADYLKKSYSDKNLLAAIESENEILIRTDTYYAIEFIFFLDYVQQHLSAKKVNESKKEFLPRKKDRAEKGKRLVELIQKNCKPWLKESAGDLIYRSTSLDATGQKTPDAFKGEVHKNRKPMDTPVEFHNTINRLFNKIGIKANRENSLFVTGDENIDYGHWRTYIIFPIGNFNYSWSPAIKDMYGFFFELGHIDSFRNEEISNVKSYEDTINLETLEEFLKKTYHNNQHLRVGIEEKSEIMINVDNYYAIEASFFEEYVRDGLFNKKVIESNQVYTPGSQRKYIVGPETEYNRDELEKKAKHIAKLIYKNSKPWFSEAGNELIYRGVKGFGLNPKLAFRGKPRTKRITQDTPVEFQNIVDSILKELGFKALRGNSFYVTGNRLATDDYGDIYVIFPIGNFDYTWSPKIRDLYFKFFKQFGTGDGIIDKFLPKDNRIYTNSTKSVAKDWFKMVDQNKLRKFLQKSYRSTNLEGAVNSNSEIMLKSDYYAIQERFFNDYVEPYLTKLKMGENLKESRVAKLEPDAEKVVELLKTNCSDAVKAFKNDIILFRGRRYGSEKFSYFDQRKTQEFRKSANTSNYFNLIVSNSPNWKDFPKRNKSMIGSSVLFNAQGYGGGAKGVYVVFPFNGAKIGMSNSIDFWDSFEEMGKKIGSMFFSLPEFNRSLSEIAEILEVEHWSQTDFKEFELGIREIQHKLRDMKNFEKVKSRMGNDGEKLRDQLRSSADPMKFLFDISDPKLNGLKVFTMKNPELPKSSWPQMYAKEWWSEGPAYLINYGFFEQKIRPRLE